MPLVAFAQNEGEPRVIVVPYPGQGAVDAGQPVQAQPAVAPEPPPPGTSAPPPTDPNVGQPPPPQQPPPQALPPPPEQPKTIEATQDPGEYPPPPPPENLQPKEVPSSPPSAMLDGHPREGAFLSGPGSLVFILHHTLLGLTAGVATQLFPRVLHSDPAVRNCNSADPSVCAQGARLSYLAAGLIGAGIGFGTSAAWQFYNWISERTAYFGLMNSLFGGMFGAGFMNLIVPDATATTWGAWVGALAGAWLSTIIGGGDLPMNKGALMMSGAYWATMFMGIVVAVVATTNKNTGNVRTGVDALLISPAIGAGAMALALLKFNPSTAQILRADLFGTAAGGLVLLISALVLGANFAHPVPYILAGVAAAGAITTVSLLWAEAAEPPPPPAENPPLTPGQPVPVGSPKPAYKGWW
ncbi:MAG: hypothetical protein IPJ65_16545 [Archangiaceae bacterium]|nr:hypothetical protein [Archangiaceae bacterium]